MKDAKLLEEVRKAVSDKLALPLSDIQENSSFTEDLSADSLDMAELLMEIEERLDISISDADVHRLVTVGDAVDLIQQQLASEQS